ncbi:MAG: hypothetical protein J1D87_02685 [Lachnospiraceae bacterium]|nr:hypothetical protein [Lachnospiraceae bacterium]
MKKSIMNRFVSILLSVCMVASLLSGCGKQEIPSKNNIEIGTNAIVEETVESILQHTDTVASTDDILEDASSILLSDNWEDYLGDMETFVYGLVANQIGYFYDVFPGYIRLSDGTEVSGIAYSDYSECYANEDEAQGCFFAGFIPYIGETEIQDSEFDAGLEIYNIEYQDEIASFVLAYRSDSFIDHCVVYGKYVKYGVDEKGSLFYKEAIYDKESVDEEIGSLYSYDDQRYLYDLDQGNYTGIAGASLSTEIDYDELQAEINRILEEQDFNFATIDIETCAYYAQEAVESYFLSIQEETFLGYDVDYLVEITSKLDPMECYRITNDRMMVFTLETGNEATSLCKWIVGSVCVVVTIVGVVSASVLVECPPLSVAAGAMSGTAIEIFMQVVLESNSLDSINWTKVVLSASTGAVSGYLGPYVYAQYGQKFAQYFLIDSVIDGVLGASERALIAWVDGGDAADVAKSFGWGFVLGAGLSAAFKGVGVTCEKLASKIAPTLKKTAEKVAPKLCAKVSKMSASAANALNGLKKRADDSVFHSEYIARKIGQNQMNKLLEEGSEELVDKAFNALKKADILDVDENVITKQTLRELFEGASDGDVIAHFSLDGEIIQIIKKNGAVGVLFDSSKYQTVTLPKGLLGDRDINFEEAAKLLKQSWIDDSSLVPESIAKAIQNTGKELEDIESTALVDIIQKSDFVLHENLDLQTITLVARKVHDKALGGIAHMGGYALAKFMKENMGIKFFDRFITAASSVAAEVGS